LAERVWGGWRPIDFIFVVAHVLLEEDKSFRYATGKRQSYRRIDILPQIPRRVD